VGLTTEIVGPRRNPEGDINLLHGRPVVCAGCIGYIVSSGKEGDELTARLFLGIELLREMPSNEHTTEASNSTIPTDSAHLVP